MGMYTELVFKASLKDDIPNDVKEVLEYMFGSGETPKTLPENKLFDLPRWKSIGWCSSFYHHPESVRSYSRTRGYIFSRSDLKNYDGEIEAFLDWIDPYLDELPGHCIGWTWYEEFDSPTLVYKK